MVRHALFRVGTILGKASCALRLLGLPVLALLVMSAAGSAWGAPGALDSSFGASGLVTTTFGGSAQPHSILIQSDGKIVVVGAASSVLTLVRYNADGSLDASFGASGVATTNGVGVGYSIRTVLQSDGKIVVAAGLGAVNLVRYNTDGSLDTSFGTNGVVSTTLGDLYQQTQASSVALQSDGKLIVTGYGTYYGSSVVVRSFVFRYNTDGSLDTSFGASGKTEINVSTFSDTINDVAIQSDGKLVLAVLTSEHFLARLNADGSLDTSFGNSGYATGLTQGKTIKQIALQSDGKIITVGTTSIDSVPATQEVFCLSRHTKDGVLDSTFGSSGYTITSLNALSLSAYALAIKPDNAILAAGSSYSEDENQKYYHVALAAYNANGSLDSSFGSGGVATVSGSANYDVAYAVAVQSDGKVVAAGVTDTSWSSNSGKFLTLRCLGATASGKHLIWQNTSSGEIRWWSLSTTGKIYSETEGYGHGKVSDQTLGSEWRFVGSATVGGVKTLFYQNTAEGTVKFWRLTDNAILGSSGLVSDTLRVTGAWSALGVRIFNGTPIIIWQNQSTGKVVYWLLNSSAQLVSATKDVGWGFVADTLTVNSNWRLAGDTTLGGSYTLFWQNQGNGKIAYWRLTSEGKLLNATQDSGWGFVSSLTLANQWRQVGVVNGNGLVWHGQSYGKIAWWLLGDDAKLTSVLKDTGWGFVSDNLTLNASWSLGAISEFDSVKTLLWHNGNNGRVAYWRINSAIKLTNETQNSGWGFVSDTLGMSGGWTLNGITD
jgi:uncharacterized delta-60 repeat protein